MRDWLVRNKKNCKEYRNNIYENNHSIEGCHGVPEEDVPPTDILILMERAQP